jgi:hypothetical protein
METEETEEMEFTTKNEKKYACQHCDFKCSFISDWKRHLTTRKHSLSVNGTLAETKKTSISCKCGKEYKSMSGLWKHKNTCIKCKSDTENKEEIEPELKSSENLIQYLLKENSEFKNLIMELVKKDFINNTNNINNNNNTINNNVNSHNKSFCLNVFLNDTCKGAMNMSEFVDTIKIQMSDLENFHTWIILMVFPKYC